MFNNEYNFKISQKKHSRNHNDIFLKDFASGGCTGTFVTFIFGILHEVFGR